MPRGYIEATRPPVGLYGQKLELLAVRVLGEHAQQRNMHTHSRRKAQKFDNETHSDPWLDCKLFSLYQLLEQGVYNW